MSVATVVEEVYRAEYGRILAALIRSCDGDFQLAEDSLSGAFESALSAWTEDVPDNPAAWLTTTARRRAIDTYRRRSTLERKLPLLHRLEVEEMPEVDSAIPDERLRLLYTCCHPALSIEAQVALTLRTLGGLSNDEIASAFLVAPATMSQRLVRARRKIKEARIPYRVPPVEELAGRTAAVLSVLYLVFNEGYRATTGRDLVRVDLISEAIRLAEVVALLLPDDAEVLGVLALMLLHDSRRHARTDHQGRPVLLEDQDRSLWDRVRIERGLTVLDKALALGSAGQYCIQAAIAAVHARAETPAATDWAEIVGLYSALLRVSPSPVIELNRAAAVAMRDGPEEGLRLMDDLDSTLGRYHLLHSARADLLRRLGRFEDSAASYRIAVDLVTNDAEAEWLRSRLEGVEELAGSQ